MVRLIGLYWYTDQLLTQYVLNHTKCTNIWYDGAYRCTTSTDSFSNRYVLPIPSIMSRYGKLWYILNGKRKLRNSQVEGGRRKNQNT